MTIGFIGLGVMGEPMCRNLLGRTEEELVVFDLRQEPMDRLAADGASIGASVSDVVERADRILLSMPGGPQLEAVMAGPAGVLSVLRKGQLVIDHTTAPLELTRELAARCHELGAEFCDAPIARTRQAAADGTLSIMVGGTVAGYASAMPVLSMMATDVTHCGGIGAGQVTKLLNNMILFQNVRAIAEAHAIAVGLDAKLGAELELDVEGVFGVIAGASGGSFALSNHGNKAVLADDYPLQAFSTEYALKDLGYVLDLAKQVSVEAIGAETVRELMESTRDAGHQDEYFPVMRRML